MAKGLLACLLLATGGCFGADVASAFPPGLEPLEPSTAGLPPQPDTVAIVTGENSNFTFGHARGRVSAAPGGVWAALKEPAVVASRRQTDSWSYTLDETPLYEYSFTIHYEVDEILTVEWDEEWRYGTIQGTPENPQLAIIRWQKVFGSSFISLIEGEISVAPAENGQTEVDFVEHVDALQADQNNIRITIQDEFAALVARSHGQPLPPL